jgi:hypothetical protein
MVMAFGQSSRPMPATADIMLAMGITAAGNDGVMDTGAGTTIAVPADIVTNLLLLREPSSGQTGSVTVH